MTCKIKQFIPTNGFAISSCLQCFPLACLLSSTNYNSLENSFCSMKAVGCILWILACWSWNLSWNFL